MSSSRSWMYTRLTDGLPNQSFITGVDEFIQFAMSHPEGHDGNQIRCPCNKRRCRNRNFVDVNEAKYHLYRHGFVPEYYVWYLHGETEINTNVEQGFHIFHGNDAGGPSYEAGGPSFQAESSNAAEQMVFEVAGPEFNPYTAEESPNPSAQHFYDMLNSANQEVWPGNENHSQLSAVARMLHIKSEHRMSERCYDEICELMQELMPTGNVMTESFYSTKKLVRGIGLPVEKIHSCINSCMIFWGDDSELTHCNFCNHPRFKPLTSNRRKLAPFKKMYYFSLTPRLQRLYASEATAQHIFFFKIVHLNIFYI